MKSARFSGAFLSGAFHAPLQTWMKSARFFSGAIHAPLPKTFGVGTFPAVEALLQEQI